MKQSMFDYIKLIKIDGSSTSSSVEQQSTSTWSAAQMELLSQVVKIFKFILIAPATNAVSERSCSALRRTKTWLRTAMTQERLNNCLILHVHKYLTDKMNNFT